MEIKYKIAKTKKELKGILGIQRGTWLSTYVNIKRGITEEIINKHYDKKWTKEYFEYRYKSLHEADKRNWIAIDLNSNEIVGWIGCVKDDVKKGSFGIYVNSKYQGHGIGKELLKRGMKWLFKTQEYIHIGVMGYNTKAIEFYKKFGFNITGEKEDFKLSDFEGKNFIVVMRKEF